MIGAAPTGCYSSHIWQPLPPSLSLQSITILHCYHDTSKEESIINLLLSVNTRSLSLSHTHTRTHGNWQAFLCCARASSCREFIFLSPLTCYVLFYLWIMHEDFLKSTCTFGTNTWFIWLYSDMSGCPAHYRSLLSIFFLPPLHKNFTQTLQNFLQLTWCSRPSAPTLTYITLIFYRRSFLGVSKPVSGTFPPLCIVMVSRQ